MSAISENLNRRFQSFIGDEKPFTFFKGLAEYIDYVHSQQPLEAVVVLQIAERDARYAEILQLEAEAVAEMREAKEKLLVVIKETGVDTSSFKRFRLSGGSANIVEEMGAFERGEYRKNGWHSDKLEAYLFDIAANLRAAGYEKEISEFVVLPEQYEKYWQRIDGPGHYTIYGDERNTFIFSQTRPKRFELIALVDKERMHKPWGDFAALLQFKDAYDAIGKNGDYFSILGQEAVNDPIASEDLGRLAMMAEDWQILIGDGSSTLRHRFSHTPDTVRYLHLATFKSHVQVVHNRLMQVAEEVDAADIARSSHKNLPGKELSAANKKRLFVLERLKEEWDLVPKESVTTHSHFGYYNVRPAGEARVTQKKFSLWIRDGGISDWYELENILCGFQQEQGLISKYEKPIDIENILLIQFPEDFEERYKKYRASLEGADTETLPSIDRTNVDYETDVDIISVQLKGGLLTLNKATGVFQFNDVSDNFNPISQEFKLLMKMLTNKNYQATYEELVGGAVSKNSKRTLGFTLDRIKTSLAILPANQSKNEDIFENIKGHGYRLIV